MHDIALTRDYKFLRPRRGSAHHRRALPPRHGAAPARRGGSSRRLWPKAMLCALGLLGSAPAEARAQDLIQLLTRLELKYKRTKSLSADFTQTYRSPASRTLSEEGTLALSRPRRMRWEYRKPLPKLLICDGAYVFFYVPSERQVVRSKIKDAGDLRVAFAFLLGSFDIHEHFSRIELLGLESPVVAGDVVLKFLPKKPQANFAELFLEVEPQSLQLRRIAILEPGGGRSDFLLSNVRENFPVKEADFAFVPPPGVDVIDERP